MTQNKKPHCGITHKHGPNTCRHFNRIDPLLLAHVLVLALLVLLIWGGAA
ncbi:MAG: hypothetical protein U1F55_00990 [Chitinivorax sp.]